MQGFQATDYAHPHKVLVLGIALHSRIGEVKKIAMAMDCPQ